MKIEDSEIKEIVYAVNNNQIIKCEITAESRRGTACWCRKLNGNGSILVSKHKLFETRELAEKYIINVVSSKKEKKERDKKSWSKENAEIEKIIGRLYDEFDFEVKFLHRPINLENAKKLYKYVKKKFEDSHR